jgi:hypothetical protein
MAGTAVVVVLGAVDDADAGADVADAAFGVADGGEAMEEAPPEVRAKPAAVPPALTTATAATITTTPNFGPAKRLRNIVMAIPSLSVLLQVVRRT